VSVRLVRRAAAASLAVLVACALAGCATGARRPQSGATTAGAPAWELPADAVPSQRLYQGSYDGPEGGGSFRATLRLAGPDRFRLDASDRLGRLLWSVGVEPGSAWWVDHHAGTWCSDLGRLRLPGIGLAPVDAAALPALLLGVLPVHPQGGRLSGEDGVPPNGSTVEVHDASGRLWSATLEAGRVTAWRLSDGGEPIWWWRRERRGGLLSQRQGRQLRWQEVVSEPLRGELPLRSVPAGYVERCDEHPPA
jgi:hypothetical protein